jgi:DNA-binding response OmpR family regulator
MTDPYRIILVEDDITLRSVLVEVFRMQGFAVEQVEGVDDFFDMWRQQQFDLVLLDLNLVDEDGLVLLRKLRMQSDIPLFVVSGRSDRETRLAALEMGADDYVVKPFDTRELVIRVQNFLNRMARIKGEEGSEPQQRNIWEFGNWSLSELSKGLAHVDGREVYLTRSEFKILLALVRAGGNVLSKMQLMDVVDRGNYETTPETIAVLIHRVRKKMADKRMIQTVSGFGYRIPCLSENREYKPERTDS